MKFGRYLRDHLTPEWKRAYIDYSACKKAIKVVARRLDQSKAGNEDSEDAQGSSDLDDDHGPAKPRGATSLRESSRGSLRSPRTNGSTRTERTPGNAFSPHNPRTPSSAPHTMSPREIPRRPSPPPPLDLGESSYGRGTETLADPVKIRRAATISEEPAHIIQNDSPSAEESNHEQDPEVSDSGRILTSPGAFKIKSFLSPKLTKSPRFVKSPRMGPGSSARSAKAERSPQVGRRSLRSLTMPSPRTPTVYAATFEELYDQLEDDERAFFDLLDTELDKVENFYSARESEAVARAAELKDQLTKLGEHRKRYHELYPAGITGAILPPQQVINLTKAADKLRLRVPFVHEGDNQSPSATQPSTNVRPGMPHAPSHGPDGNTSGTAEPSSAHLGSYSLERYQQYKRELRTATLDFYRHLERIKNYRILNLTGFRKALKKFEKTTKIHCMDLYTDERISKESFAKGEAIEKLLDQMEKLYSEHFEHGDTKKARDRLRRQTDMTTHHYSVFRSGICIGLGLPAAVFALVLARQEETQLAIPANEALLQVYGALYIPVIFGMLFELNLNAFVSARINYEFVMELTKPTLDSRSFLEIPAFLFLTLSYCFFFSFYRVGASNVAPTTWPAAWLIFVVVFFLNPLDIFRRSSRYWFLRVLFRVCTPGYSRVEFIAFFLADELNSLVYTIENVYFMACSYTKHWPADTFQQCPVGQRWPYGLMLALPPLSRLIQCLKRYHDSNIGIHLINAGKYFSVITQYSLFVLWRSRGSDFQDPAFVVWIVIAATAAAYTSSWDLIVDWSLFRPNSAMLREERGYRSPYVYYFAMITNVLIRWEWIWYLPASRHHVRFRTFFLALAEMLRRWQWNFFRVETEHLGNADAYRVTREIPLPYRRVEPDSEEDDLRPIRSNKPQGPIGIRLQRLKSELMGHNDKDERDDSGRPVGHERPRRDYEAGRRLDVVPTRTRSHQSPQV